MFALVALSFFAADPAPVAAPAGMHAVAAVTAAVGSGDAARDVAVDAFFVDDEAVSVADYDRCVKAGGCAAATGKPGRGNKARVDWVEADRACAFFGKRLPSEAEFTAAHVDNADDEWTATWFIRPSLCTEKSAPLPTLSKSNWFPPALCGARDRLDPCDGATLCGTLQDRVTRSSSTPERSKSIAAAGGGLHTFRCVSSTPVLATYPSKWSTPRTPPPELTPPTPDELAKFKDVVEDTLEVPACDKAGRSFLTCRDPRSYLKTNEPRIQVVEPYVTNLGGGYTGVASDQNYTFVALARSQWVWLFDYDANVVRWHHILLALIAQSADRAAFVELLSTAQQKKGVAAIDASAFSDDEKKELKEMFRSSAPRLQNYYRRQLDQKFTWLGDDVHFNWLKTLVQQGRILAVRGNMLDEHAMQSIGKAARNLGVPMRIYYPSNAPEFWIFTDQYRKNVAALPFDDESIVVQTISGLKSGFDQTGYWHYNIQWGHQQHELLARPGYTRLKQLLNHRIRAESGEITLSGLPAR